MNVPTHWASLLNQDLLLHIPLLLKSFVWVIEGIRIVNNYVVVFKQSFGPMEGKGGKIQMRRETCERSGVKQFFGNLGEHVC
jgi:hypothetical protein